MFISIQISINTNMYHSKRKTSVKRKSASKHRSMKRRSVKRSSMKRRSMKRSSVKRRSVKRSSMKRRSVSKGGFWGMSKKKGGANEYQKFMKTEIKKVKAENPKMKHQDAFKKAASNWKGAKKQ